MILYLIVSVSVTFIAILSVIKEFNKLRRK